MVHEKYGAGSVLVFDPLELSGHGIKRFFPRDWLEFPAASFPHPFQGLFEAVFRVHDLFLGETPGTGFQAGQRPFPGVDSGDFTFINVYLQEAAAAAVVITTGGHYLAFGTISVAFHGKISILFL
jgi:hypothetical protein